MGGPVRVANGMSKTGSDFEPTADAPGGVRAQLEVDPDGTCPLVSAASELDASARSMTRTPSDDGRVVEQFAVENAEADLEGVDAEPVFDYADRRVYQTTRPAGNCVCELIEQLDCPVADVRAEDGALRVTLHLLDVDRLRTVVEELGAQFGDVKVRYLARTDPDREGEDLIPIDRGQLTDRQLEVLGTAYEMGYFEYPREANASEVAEAIGIGLSTTIEHLTAAQSKLLDEVVDRPEK